MSDAVVNGAKGRNDSRYRGKGRAWATPPSVFEPLQAEFGFTVDACADGLNAKLARYWSEAEDGLAQDWSAEVVWMNPPYGREIRAWIRKAREASDAGALVVGLVPAETDSDWWHEHILGRAEIRYLRGRIRFLVHQAEGPTRWASPFRPSVVVVWRPRATEQRRAA
jgi:phage N-6-adenine-methyltransferase